MIVLDASFLVKLVVEEEGSEEAERLLEEWVLGGEELSTVDIALAESSNALWKHHVLHGDLGLDEYYDALGDLERIWRGLRRYSTQSLIHVAAKLAVEHTISIYDALYLALAVREKAVLATFDKKLARHARSIGVNTVPATPG